MLVQRGLDKHQPAEVPIPRHENALLLLGDLEQIGIAGLRQAQLGDGDNIMPQLRQQASRGPVDVLIEKEFHFVADVM